jgi:hypothetical protein
MEKLNEQQQQAYKTLLNILQEKGKQYVYTQGQNIEWFTVKEIEEAPFFEIKYIHESYVTVKFHTHENGYQQFVLKLHDEVCKEQIITEETNSYFFAKEFEVSTFVMECLNEMYKIKEGGILGHLSINDDGSPLANFKKSFMMGFGEQEPSKPKTMQEHKDAWFEENAPFGKELGYPECCIKEFCDQPPALLKRNKTPSKDDKRRYKAGCINGNFTGFIPCAFHAKEITMGKITLQSLIQNRNKDFNPFPNF